MIPQRHHRTVMGARGAKVKDITAEFDVQIKFPERDTTEGADVPSRDIDENAEPGPNDIIKITGRPENCEGAKKALLEQVESLLTNACRNGNYIVNISACIFFCFTRLLYYS